MMMKSSTEDEYLLIRSPQFDSKMNPPPPPYNYSEEEDDEDDALSLCDLSIYSDASADWSTEQQLNDFNTSTTCSRSASFSSTEMLQTGTVSTSSLQRETGSTDGSRNRSDSDDLFEFLSSELSHNPAIPDNNIIFCGRVLTDVNPSGGRSTSRFNSDQKFLKAADTPRRRSTSRKNRLLHWIIRNKSSSVLGDSNIAASTTAKEGLEKQETVVRSVEAAAGKLSTSVAKQASSRLKSTMTPSCSGIGFGRMPLSEMKLDEIKSRQVKRSMRTYLELYEEEQRRSDLKNSTGGFLGLMRSFSSRVRRPF